MGGVEKRGEEGSGKGGEIGGVELFYPTHVCSTFLRVYLYK